MSSATSVPDPRFSRRRWVNRFARLRLLWVLLGAVIVLGLVGWVVWGTSALGVRHVVVDGAAAISQDQVVAAAAIGDGTPLAKLDVDAVAARVESLPLVANASVRRDWPRSVVISVRERVAVAVVEVDGSTRALDRDGVLFRAYDKAPPELPVVRLAASGDAADEAMREVATVVRSLDEQISRRLERVRAASMDSIILKLTDGALVRWGSAADSGQKALVLAQLLKQDATVYDVTAPERPTTRS